MDTFLFSLRPEEVEAEDEDDESDEVGLLSGGLLLFFYSLIQLQQYSMIRVLKFCIPSDNNDMRTSI